MTQSAWLPSLLEKSESRAWHEIVAFVSGVGLISLLAQIAIPLPWTPVPITGQTLGVTLVALLWGQKRGVALVVSYLALGASGAPVFANGAAFFVWGPTSGYLLGMILSAALIGHLADRGWTKSLFKTWLACALGSACVFAVGLFVLSYFIPSSLLLGAGLWPFLPGDLIKTLIAISIVRTHARLFISEKSENLK